MIPNSELSMVISVLRVSRENKASISGRNALLRHLYWEAGIFTKNVRVYGGPLALHADQHHHGPFPFFGQRRFGVA